jgi:protein-S-isoprenylcysteine O-methyltransferase Ste14
MQLARFLAAADPAHRWQRAVQAGFLLCVAAALFLSDADLLSGFAEPVEDVWELAALSLALAGVAVRMVMFGFADKPAVRLQTTGLHSVVRHPELLSDALIAMGFILGTQVSWLILAGAALLPLYLWLSVRTRDEGIARHLGAIVASWRQDTPALLIDLSRWDAGRASFSLSRAFEQGLPNLVLCLAAMTAFEIAHDVKIDGGVVSAWPVDWWFYIVPLAATLLLAVLVPASSRTFSVR